MDAFRQSIKIQTISFSNETNAWKTRWLKQIYNCFCIITIEEKRFICWLKTLCCKPYNLWAANSWLLMQNSFYLIYFLLLVLIFTCLVSMNAIALKNCATWGHKLDALNSEIMVLYKHSESNKMIFFFPKSGSTVGSAQTIN